MKTIERQIIDTLNQLIAVCEDGEEGFKTAAKNIRAGEMSQLFLTYSGERGKYIRELQKRIAGLGGDSGQTCGTVSGSVHRGWMNLKAAVATNDAHAILIECEHGEEAAATVYREALRTELDPETLEIVAPQARRVQITHRQVKQLLDGVSVEWR